MKRALRVLVRALQLLFAVFGLGQIGLLLPELYWLAVPPIAPIGSWFLLGIKAVAAAVALLMAWSLGRLHYSLGGGSVSGVQVRS
ncbi:hypothetical protein [Arhodomonas aquaeolei]|uniref:hypothetical protein n=1 Tax=Arhodomonas aquaeolei TaxID=2369 RepID=UPI000360758D|nr:hypothetical protein [Arhodomonas aquaeolei]